MNSIKKIDEDLVLLYLISNYITNITIYSFSTDHAFVNFGILL